MRNRIDLNGSGRLIAIFLAMTIALSVFAGGVMAAPSDEISYEGDNTAPNPTFDIGELTISSHPMEYGATHDDMAGYYNDNGEWQSNPGFSVNTTSDVETGDNVNPYMFKPSHAENPSFAEFPRTGTDDDGEQENSILNASEWTVDESGSAGTMTVEETSVASNADALRVSTDAQGADDTATATYSNIGGQLDSDEDKRVLQIGVDVNDLDAGATVDISLVDESGDMKTVQIDPDADQSETDQVVAGSTGTFVYQQKLSDMEGDELNNIESVEVAVHDADADLAFSWIDAERMGTTTLGEQYVQDDDGDFTETEEITTASGDIEVHSMETLDSMFDDAVINDVTFSATKEAKDITGDHADDGDYLIAFEEAAQYPAFDHLLETHYRMSIDSAIDLSYNDVELTVEQSYPSDRYQELGVAEDVSSSTNMTEADLNDQTAQLGSSGDTVTLQQTVQTDMDYVIGASILVTGEEKDDLQTITGAGAAPAAGGSGPIDFLFSLPGMLLSLAGGILSLRWLRSGE